MMAFFMVMIFLYASGVFAGPEGAQVINGQVSFQQSGLNTTITASNKAIINYTSFDIARPEVVEFIQPSSTASVLNRILSANPTAIDGTLLANGRVFFINPAGVIIGEGARINVNQLVASALDMSNSDFLNGRYNFAGGYGPVINRGDIVAEKVYLIAKQVANSGTISCPDGYVVMASGDRVFIGEVGSDVVVEIDIPSGSADPLEGAAVLNEGTIDVGSGTIVVAAAGDIYAQAISNVGTLSASTQSGNAGQVKLAAADGVIANIGSIEAKSGSAAGGVVSAEGAAVVNLGTIDVTGAEGGQVAMNAGSRIGQFGTIHADGTIADGGDIDLVAGELTVVGDGSVTTANAGLNGNGGEIRVLADMEAGFAGLGPDASLQAKGGTESGDGGFIELSARNFQTYAGIDVSATQGAYGTFLLDPTDIIVRNSGASTQDYNGAAGANPFPDYSAHGLAFARANNDFDADLTYNEVASRYIDFLLDGGNNVILQATQDITINDLTNLGTNYPIQWTTSADLVLQAGRSITIGPFTSSDYIGNTGGGDIHIEAFSPHTTQQIPGRITIGSNVEIGTRGATPGTVTLIGADFVLDGYISTCAAATTVGTVEIGPATTLAGGWNLSSADAPLTNTELGHIRTDTLIIGEATTAGASGVIGSGTTITIPSITVDNITGPFNFSILHLIAGGIADADTTGASNLSVTNLILEAAGSIGSIANPLDIDTGAVDVEKGGLGSTDVVLYDHSGGVVIRDLNGDLYGADLAAGDLSVTADSPITINGDIIAAGDITLTANEDLLSPPPDRSDDIRVRADITSTTGNITLQAGDDIALNAPAPCTIWSQLAGGTVTLTSAYNDSGTDGGSSSGAGSILGGQAKIKADNITLQVAGTVTGTVGMASSSVLIDLGTGTLTLATGSATGNMYVEETNGDSYSSKINVSTAGGIDIYFENSDGSIDIDRPIDAGSDNLTLTTTGIAKDITFSRSYPGVLQSAIAIQTTGNLTLDASGAIKDNISNTAIDAQGAVVTLNAYNGGIGAPSPLPTDDRAVEVYATTQFNADTGLGVNGDNSDIYINSIGDLPIGRINAADAGVPTPRGDLYLTSTGNMTDARPGPGPNLLGDKAELTTSTGIGDDSTGAGDLNVHLNELEATTVTGDIYVTDTLGGLIVGDTLPTVGATITAGSSATDNIVITADSPLTINGLVSGPGNITLTAGNSGSTGDDLTLNANVTSTGASTTITLNAGDSILQNSGSVSNTNAAGGTITATANNEGDAGTGGDDGSAAVFTQSSGTSFVSNGGPITVSSYGNATLRLLDAGTTGTVGVKSANGSIIDNRGRGNPNIIGYAALLDAFTGVGSTGNGDIDTTLAYLAADTQTGGIYVTNNGGLCIAGVTAPFGTVTGVQVTGSGDIVVATTNGWFTVAAPVSGPANITLTAGGSTAQYDNLQLNNPVTSTGTGTTITLNAGDSILQTMGSVSITGGGTIIATANTEDDDDSDLCPAEFTQFDYPTSFVSNGGNIYVLSYDDAKLTELNAGAGSVCVFSSAGAIKDNTAAETANIIAGNVMLLDAYTGIGGTGADDIQTTTPYLAADTQTGGIYITNTGGLTIGSIGSPYGGVSGAKITAGGAPADDIVIVATSPLTVISPVEGPGDITLTAGNSGAAGDDLTLSENVTSRGAGTITLNAGDSIIQTNSYIVQTNGGQIIATADTEGDSSGAFTQADGASFVSGGGPITVSAYGNADLSLLNAGAGAVQVTSTNGAITDNTSPGELANIIGLTARLDASTGIGSTGAGDIDTSIRYLAAVGILAAHTQTGGIYITDTGGWLSIGTLAAMIGVQITTPGAPTDDIVIIATSPLSVDALVQGPGNITLTAGNSTSLVVADDLTLNANVISAGGGGTAINLNAGDGISQTDTHIVQTSGGAINATANTENDAGADGFAAGFTQADGASFVSNGGVILVSSYGDAKLSLLDAAGGGVAVLSTAGAITDNTAAETANIISGFAVALDAYTGIGSTGAGDIETTTSNLAAETYTGGIYVTNTGGLTIANIISPLGNVVGAQISGPGTDIVIIATSPLTVAWLVYGPANITLTAGNSGAPGDDLTLNANVTSTGGAGTTIALNAGDDIIQTNSYVVQTAGGAIVATANTENDAGLDTDTAGFSQTDGASFISGGGPITVSAYGNAALSLLDAGTTGAVEVTTTNGAITDNTALENANIIGSTAVLDASTGIGIAPPPDGDIDTDIDKLEAETATGWIFVTNAGGLTIGDIGAMVGAQITGAGSDIVIIATSPLTVDELVHGPANITLTAGNDTVNPGDDLTLNADVTSDGGVGTTIALYAGDSIIQNYGTTVSTAGGAIVATANNELSNADLSSAVFTQAHRTSFVSGGGPITVSSYGDATLCLLDAGAGAVAVTTTNGAIIDNRWARANIIGSTAVLDAFTGVGSPYNGDIDTDIANLEADTQTGGIYVTNDGALTIGGIGAMIGAQATGASGDIVIAATSPLTVSELVHGPANITLTAGGTSSGTADDLTLNANVTSDGGAGTTIALNAGDSIIQNTGTTVSTSGGAIVATADTEGDYGSDGYPAGFTQNGTASFVSGGGPISVYSYGDAAISLLNAGATGAVTVTSTNGAITDNRPSSAVNIIGYSADLDAYNGIGDTGYDDIDTDIDYLEAETYTGGIYVTNVGPLTIGIPGDGLKDCVWIWGDGGNIVIKATGSLTVNEFVEGPHDITLTAGSSGSSDNLILNEDVTSRGDGTITLNAGDNISQTDSYVVRTNGGQINATADTEDNSSGSFTQSDGASFVSNGGDISVYAYGDVELSLLDAGAGDVYVTSDNGAITDNTATENANIIGDFVWLTAWTGIGGSDLETSATTVWAFNNGNGNIDIHNTLASDASVFTWIFGIGDTRFIQDGGGNLSLIGAITYDGTIWVQVDDGGDLLAQGPCHISAGGTYDLLHDSRESINFLDEPLDGRDPGDPFDLAVYLASTGGNVIVDMPVTIPENQALVIDAYDTVTFGGTFEDNANVDWLEVCSRITETLNEAAAWETLPYVDEFGSNRNPPWFDGEYVLRGGLPDAWVLHWVNIFPWPPVITFEPGKFIAPPVRNFEPEKEGVYMPAGAEFCPDDAYLCSTDVLKPSE
jgi:filamentous hemagglutinin family protein